MATVAGSATVVELEGEKQRVATGLPKSWRLVCGGDAATTGGGRCKRNMNKLRFRLNVTCAGKRTVVPVCSWPCGVVGAS